MMHGLEKQGLNAGDPSPSFIGYPCRRFGPKTRGGLCCTCHMYVLMTGCLERGALWGSHFTGGDTEA